MNTTKYTYTEPQTIVSEVEMEGFICVSEVQACTQVDEINNMKCFEMTIE